MPAPHSVLFICTGNCCRSQMAEATLQHLGGERFRALSAGSSPAGYIHPLALKAMQRLGTPISEDQYSKSWDEFANERLDIVITLCDGAASQPCPAWPGHPATAHWSLPDPSFRPGTEEERLAAAEAVARRLRYWIERLIALPIDGLAPDEIKIELQRIADE